MHVRRGIDAGHHERIASLDDELRASKPQHVLGSGIPRQEGDGGESGPLHLGYQILGDDLDLGDDIKNDNGEKEEVPKVPRKPSGRNLIYLSWLTPAKMNCRRRKTGKLLQKIPAISDRLFIVGSRETPHIPGIVFPLT
jgi:hypothetical protein